jgi:hypothetical protein
MNIFYAICNLLKDFWNLLEEFMEHMHSNLIQNNTENDDTVKTE